MSAVYKKQGRPFKINKEQAIQIRVLRRDYNIATSILAYAFDVNEATIRRVIDRTSHAYVWDGVSVRHPNGTYFHPDQRAPMDWELVPFEPLDGVVTARLRRVANLGLKDPKRFSPRMIDAMYDAAREHPAGVAPPVDEARERIAAAADAADLERRQQAAINSMFRKPR